MRITGPKPLSYAEMTAKIGAAIGERLYCKQISDEEVHRQMIESGDSAEVVAAHLLIYSAIRAGRLAKVTDTVERVLGRKPVTFDQWVQENLGAFANPVRV